MCRELGRLRRRLRIEGRGFRYGLLRIQPAESPQHARTTPATKRPQPRRRRRQQSGASWRLGGDQFVCERKGSMRQTPSPCGVRGSSTPAFTLRKARPVSTFARAGLPCPPSHRLRGPLHRLQQPQALHEVAHDAPLAGREALQGPARPGAVPAVAGTRTWNRQAQLRRANRSVRWRRMARNCGRHSAASPVRQSNPRLRCAQGRARPRVVARGRQAERGTLSSSVQSPAKHFAQSMCSDSRLALREQTQQWPQLHQSREGTAQSHTLEPLPQVRPPQGSSWGSC